MISDKIKYLLLSILIIPFACERDVENVRLPEFKQKLVITSFISPSDTTSYFLVTSNRKIYGELNIGEPLGTLTGSLSNGSAEVALDPIENGFRISRKKMPVEYGKTYRLKISGNGGLSSEAECTVPAERNFNIRVDTFSVPRQSQGPVPFTFRSPEFNLTIKDIAGEENFYRISARVRDYYTDHNTGLLYKSIIDSDFEEEFFTDKGMDGEEIIIKTDFSIYIDHYSRDSAILEIALFNTEKSYYLYHRSLDNYSDGENPFTEVTPVYSNILDGLGVFTSYTIDSLIYRIK